MTYTSVEQIFGEIDETRERLCRRVESLSDEEATTRPGPEAWTISQVVEHLAKIEDRLLRMMTMMMTKAEGAAAGRDESAPVEMKPFSLDALIERSRREKYTAPEAVAPGGTDSLADSLARLRRSREELRALRPRIEAIDLSGVTYPHPAFGPLDFYQWLAFIGLHEERHLRQIEAILAA